MLGTGDFALPTFRLLYGSPHEVLALYTQPDRPTVGRHKPHQPLKDLALVRGTPVLQPANINIPEELAAGRFQCRSDSRRGLRSILVQIIGDTSQRNHQCACLTPPKIPAAAPINYALLNGETESGVTIIEVVPKLDAGPMLGRVKPILPRDCR